MTTETHAERAPSRVLVINRQMREMVELLAEIRDLLKEEV